MSNALRIGIAGLGNVGGGVVKALAQNAELIARRAGRAIVVTAVSARDRSRDRGVSLDGIAWVDDASELATRDDVDVVVELIGGSDGPALTLARRSFAANKPLVTANKAMLAHHGLELAMAAEQAGLPLKYEAAVAGGIPVIKGLAEGAAANRITRVYGLMNGTCNYILSRMELEGLSFEECLKDAQRLGYAEADPTFDIGGFDTAHKLAILTALAFGTQVDAEAIHVEGIQSITLADLKSAEELGYRIKLLGVAQRTDKGIEQRVHPTMVPKSSSLAEVMGVTNAVTIDADAVKELTLVGPGAGGMATASAVVADISDIAKGIRSAPFGLPTSALEKAPRIPVQRHEGGYYIRLSVHDRPGAAAAIATRMAERQISLQSIMQRHASARGARAPSDATPVPVVLITYATSEAVVREALDAVVADGYLAGAPQVIRIERE